MSVQQAARRLLKSRLRRHVMLALASERPTEAWLSAAEVEEGASEEAWAAWRKACLAYAFPKDIPMALREALKEALADVRSTFDGVVPEAWLTEQFESFSSTFDANDFAFDYA